MLRDSSNSHRHTSEHENSGDAQSLVAPSPAFERHYSVAEIAALWNLSPDVVRRLFRNEPDVLAIGDSNPKHKRRYVTLAIPESVVARVHRSRSLL
jgi:hypothetical protein